MATKRHGCVEVKPEISRDVYGHMISETWAAIDCSLVAAGQGIEHRVLLHRRALGTMRKSILVFLFPGGSKRGYKLAISPSKSNVPVGVSANKRDTSGWQLSNEVAEPEPEPTVSVFAVRPLLPPTYTKK